MKRSLVVMLCAMAAPFAAAPAGAQALCGDRDEIVSRLETGYKESASALGIAGTGGVVELYTSEKGSWTLLLTQPNGVSCLLAAGESWETLPDAKPASQKAY